MKTGGTILKNIAVIIGSPRKNGNTEILANAFIEGAKNSGNNVEVISVIGKKIGSCIGCNACYREEHKCVQDDDMTQCYEQLAKAEVIVIATPIYFYGVSSQLKCLIDRLHNPIRNGFQVKKLALLAVCADTKQSVFDSVKVMYRSVLEYFSLEDGGIITAFGVKDKGDIHDSSSLEEAKKLGETI
jgi:multimeric flavodoxin WrbA